MRKMAAVITMRIFWCEVFLSTEVVLIDTQNCQKGATAFPGNGWPLATISMGVPLPSRFCRAGTLLFLLWLEIVDRVGIKKIARKIIPTSPPARNPWRCKPESRYWHQKWYWEKDFWLIFDLLAFSMISYSFWLVFNSSYVILIWFAFLMTFSCLFDDFIMNLNGHSII